MSFAAVSCSHHWTPMCDAINARVHAELPYVLALYGVIALVALIGCWRGW